MIDLIHGDCLEKLRALPADSLDSLVTDPPAGISFMGKSWDSNKGGREPWIAWLTEVMRECYRVLKPGAHGLVWAIPRTSHWTATALEQAGFEVRDVITHLFGTGFPKSLDVSKAIDAKLLHGNSHPRNQKKANEQSRTKVGERTDPVRNNGFAREYSEVHTVPITTGATDAAKQWQGWGTALKPAVEFWWLIRKPISEKTVAANVLKYGTGGVNVDACRIASPDDLTRECKGWASAEHQGYRRPWMENAEKKVLGSTNGRFPANLVLSHNEDCGEQCTDGCAVAMLDEQSGELKSGASRFFYCAKASKQDRNRRFHGQQAPDSEGDETDELLDQVDNAS